MIYSKSGEPLQSVYGANGNALTKAYSKDGLQIYESGKTTLKVMSYNVGQWYIGSGDNVPSAKDSAYYALQNGMIQQEDPDILCIQEYWKTFSKAGRTAKSMLQQYYPYIHEQGGDSGYFGRCICSKFPISDYTVRVFTGEQDRYYDSCTVTVENVPITVVNTHLGLTQTVRDAEIAELITFLNSKTRFLCCGDFNTAIVEGTGKESQEYIDNVKPFIDAGFHTANFGDFGFFVTQILTRNLCLDNCYTSANINITSAYIDTTKLTDGITDAIDHLPLIATVQLN